MGIILWIIFGALAGWIASKIMKRDKSMGAMANIIVGIIGAALGGWISSAVFGEGITGFNLWSLLIAIAGACLLLLIFGAIRSGVKSESK